MTCKEYKVTIHYRDYEFRRYNDMEFAITAWKDSYFKNNNEFEEFLIENSIDFKRTGY